MQKPTIYELVINMKSARDFGLNIPENLLLRADQVVD